METYFQLFSHCIPQSGSNGIVLLDLQTHRVKEIPKSLYEVLSVDGLSVNALKAHFGHLYDEGIDQYLPLLTKERYGFFSHTPALLAPLPEEWAYPGEVSNAQIEIGEESRYELPKILEELDDLGGQALKFIFNKPFHKSGYEALQAITLLTRESGFRYIELHLGFHWYEQAFFTSLLRRNSRFQKVCFYDCLKKDIFQTEDPVLEGRMSFFSGSIAKAPSLRDESRTPHTLPYPNLDVFRESKLHNVGLNGKVAIDQHGHIKHHLLHSDTFGDISQHSIKEVVRMPEFKRKWMVHNGLVERCSNCKLRRICVDDSDLEEVKSGWKKKENCGLIQ